MSWSATGPSLAGFGDFIANVMGVPTAALPTNAPIIGIVLSLATTQVNTQLPDPPYTLAVYNLAGSLLINLAPDQSGQTFFATLRTQFGVASFAAGVVSAAGDGGTSDALTVSGLFANLSFDDLQRLKDPYGRQYLAYAMAAGSLFDIS